MKTRKKVNVSAPSFPGREPSGALGQPVQSQSQSAPSSLFSVFGGFDGIMSMIGKIQKMFGIYRQLRPAFNMLSSFMGPKATISNTTTKKKNKKRNLTEKRKSIAKNR
ncbi:hypothetical protein [Paenibacillus sp. GCM10027626]|uniref:hypothetical protein n=1 Tax=Paenibacillus sp. GCM10027626 TaxID=3273411 RepID=UPI0036402741